LGLGQDQGTQCKHKQPEADFLHEFILHQLAFVEGASRRKWGIRK
jgi:hypothetical protein